MLLGSGAFLGGDEVTWVELAWMDFLPLQMTPREPLAPPNTARRRLSMNQKAGPHQTRNLPASSSWTSRSLNCENEMSVVHNPTCSVAFYYCFAQTDWDSHRPRITNLCEPCCEEKNAWLLTRVSAVLAVSLRSILTLFKISNGVVCLLPHAVSSEGNIFYTLIPSYFLWKVWILEDFRRWDFKSKLLFWYTYVTTNIPICRNFNHNI